jgi:cytochrome c
MNTQTIARHAAGLALALAATAVAAAPNDQAMLELAARSGCLSCHQVEPGGKGPDGLAPIGPAWREVATKYKGQKGAANQLTHVVLTGTNPYESHWKGKVSGLAMPPNAVAITKKDARRLVGWILSLPPAAAN